MCVFRLAHPRACQRERGCVPRPGFRVRVLAKRCLLCSDRLSTASGGGGGGRMGLYLRRSWVVARTDLQR